MAGTPHAAESRVPQATVPGFTIATLAGRIALAILGEGRVSTSAGNAWQAVLADRARAAERARQRDLYDSAGAVESLRH